MRGDRLKASFTVEAAFIVSATLWSIVSFIGFVFSLHDQTVGATALMEAVEVCRSQEEFIDCREAEALGAKRAGHPFSVDSYNFKIKLSGTEIFGRRVEGKVRAGKWSTEIDSRIFDPENFLRKASLAEGRDESQDGGERVGDHISPGNEP